MKIGKAEVRLAAFDRSHERSVDTAHVSESLLRVPSLQTEFADSLSQGYQDILHFHESGSMLSYASTALG